MHVRRFREFREFGTDASLKLFVEAVKNHEDKLQDTIDKLNFPVTVDGMSCLLFYKTSYLSMYYRLADVSCRRGIVPRPFL